MFVDGLAEVENIVLGQSRFNFAFIASRGEFHARSTMYACCYIRRVRLVQTVKSNVPSSAYYFIAHVVRFDRENRLVVSKRVEHVPKNAACH